MKLLTRSLLASTLGLWTALSGVATAADSACPAPSAGEPTEEAGPRAPHHHHGLFHAIGELLDQLDLSPDQRTAVQALGQKLAPVLRDAHHAKHAVVLALADQLESGRIDPDALEPQIAAFVDASSKASPVLHAAIDELHQILTPEQRQKFAGALEARIAEHRQHHSAAARLDRLARDLELTDEQKDQFRAAFAKYEPILQAHRDLLDRVIDAWRGESFSVEQLLPGFDPAVHARAVAQMMIDMTDTTAKILTPSQRALLAQKIREKHHHEHTGTIQQPSPEASGAGAMPESVRTSQDALWGGGSWFGAGFPGYAYQFGMPSYGYPGFIYGYPPFGGFGAIW